MVQSDWPLKTWERTAKSWVYTDICVFPVYAFSFVFGKFPFSRAFAKAPLINIATLAILDVHVLW